MYSGIENTKQLLDLVISKTLYKALIIQLNKDFQLSSIDVHLSENIIPDDLKKELYTIVSQLIHNDFDSFVNLLYRIDLSENVVKKQCSQHTEAYIERICFELLKREWQKVWFKQNYSS